MGAVYEAQNPRINRRVAIKILLPEYAERNDVVRRFFNEARAVNAINHPGVVQVSDVGKSPDGSLYLVMEFLEGETLSDRLLHNRGLLPQEDVITISWQLAGVLSAAHAKAIVHRDLKPGNIMLVPDMAGPGGERVKLLDFGIAKLGAEHSHGEEVKTRTGQVMGTAAYMSPEQFQGDVPVDGQSDVYSLGVVMFRMLAGRLPFVSTSGEVALAAMHMFKQPPPLRELAKGASPWMASLIEQMLLKEGKERPTMNQVLIQLQEYLPFRTPSRTSLPRIVLDGSGALRLSSTDPTVAAEHSTEAAPEVEIGTATPVEEAAPSHSSQPGTITRATGQAAATPRNRRRRSLLFAGGFSVLAMSLGGFLALRTLTGTRPSAATLAPSSSTLGSGLPAAPLSPAAQSNPSPSSLPGTAAQAEPTPATGQAAGPAASGKNPDSLRDSLQTDPSSETPQEKAGHRIHASTNSAGKTTGKTADRTDGKRDGKARSSHKPASTPIIN
jgi:serine/threonine-protein kinase